MNADLNVLIQLASFRSQHKAVKFLEELFKIELTFVLEPLEVRKIKTYRCKNGRMTIEHVVEGVYMIVHASMFGGE